MSASRRHVATLTVILALSQAACTININPQFEEILRFIRQHPLEVVDGPSFRLPDFGVPKPQLIFVQGNQASVRVAVRNEGVVRSPDFNVLIQVWGGSPLAPILATTERWTALDPMAESSKDIDIPLPGGRPVDILVRVTADPPTATSPGGDVWESNETNNVRERAFTIY